MEWKLFADLGDAVGARRVPVDVEPGATVEEALSALLSSHPDLRDRVTDDGGELEEHVNVVLNGRTLDEAELASRIEADDELALFPPVSGG